MYVHVYFIHNIIMYTLFLSASPKRMMSSDVTAKEETSSPGAADWSDQVSSSVDNRFSEFQKLCQRLEKEPSYNAKTQLVADFIQKGSSGGVCSCVCNCDRIWENPTFFKFPQNDYNV